MEFGRIRKLKEVRALREGLISDWRKDLQEEHPYVDVMPSTNQTEKDAKKDAIKSKKKEKREEEVKEETIEEGNWFTDVFTGDTQARRDTRAAKAGTGGGSGKDVGYNPNTGTSRTKSGKDVVFARKNGESGVIDQATGKWHPTGSADAKGNQQAARRHDQIQKGLASDADAARQGRGGSRGRDYGYDPNTGTSQTTDQSGKTDNRVFARKNGKPGFKNTETGDWQEANPSHRATQQAARRHDQVSAGNAQSSEKAQTSEKPSSTTPSSTTPVASTPSSTTSTQSSQGNSQATSRDRMANSSKEDRMAAWAKANPKLAKAQTERDRTRGTNQTTNPLMKDMKSGMPDPKPVSTPTVKTPKVPTTTAPKPVSTPTVKTPTAPKPVSTPTVKTPKVPTMKKPTAPKPVTTPTVSTPAVSGVSESIIDKSNSIEAQRRAEFESENPMSANDAAQLSLGKRTQFAKERQKRAKMKRAEKK